MKKIRLFVVEDNRLLREGITVILNEQSDMKVVASFGTGESIPGKIQALKPNIVLLDLGLRSQNSLTLIRTIREKTSEVRIIVMDLVPTESDILDCVKAGVSGFVIKDASINAVLKTIRSVARGAKVLPSLLTDSLFSQIVSHALQGNEPSRLIEAVRMTKREHQVIDLIAGGLTNKEIGQRLHLSTFTVKSHVHNILEKLAMHTRVQIATYARDSETFKAAANAISLMDS